MSGNEHLQSYVCYGVGTNSSCFFNCDLWVKSSHTLSYPFAQIQYFKFPMVLVFVQYLMDVYSALRITVYHVFPQKCCQPWPHERSNAMLVKCTFLLHIISYKTTCLTADRLRVLQPLWSIYCSLSLSEYCGVTTAKLTGHCLTFCLSLTYQ